MVKLLIKEKWTMEKKRDDRWSGWSLRVRSYQGRDLKQFELYAHGLNPLNKTKNSTLLSIYPVSTWAINIDVFV